MEWQLLNQNFHHIYQPKDHKQLGKLYLLSASPQELDLHVCLQEYLKIVTKKRKKAQEINNDKGFSLYCNVNNKAHQK